MSFVRVAVMLVIVLVPRVLHAETTVRTGPVFRPIIPRGEPPPPSEHPLSSAVERRELMFRLTQLSEYNETEKDSEKTKTEKLLGRIDKAREISLYYEGKMKQAIELAKSPLQKQLLQSNLENFKANGALDAMFLLERDLIMAELRERYEEQAVKEDLATLSKLKQEKWHDDVVRFTSRPGGRTEYVYQRDASAWFEYLNVPAKTGGNAFEKLPPKIEESLMSRPFQKLPPTNPVPIAETPKLGPAPSAPIQGDLSPHRYPRLDAASKHDRAFHWESHGHAHPPHLVRSHRYPEALDEYEFEINRRLRGFAQGQRDYANFLRSQQGRTPRR